MECGGQLQLAPMIRGWRADGGPRLAAPDRGERVVVGAA